MRQLSTNALVSAAADIYWQLVGNSPHRRYGRGRKLPNWTTNTLTVSGDPKTLLEFRDAILWGDPKEPDRVKYKLVNLMPMPAVLEGTTSPSPRTPEQEDANARAYAETGYYNWLDWQSAHWGVEWGDVFVNHFLSLDGCLFIYEYHTPRAELSDAFWAVVEQAFPKLTLNVQYQHEE